jgi:hypothetical protein
MKIHVRFTGSLYNAICSDLARPHPFAAERVGFALGRLGTRIGQDKTVLLTGYAPVPDADYDDDPTVGARIGRSALTSAMQAVYHGRATQCGIFHVHQHCLSGRPGMSRTDARELPRLIPGFQSVGPNAPHGIMILSSNHGAAWVWLPGKTGLVLASSIEVIGPRIEVFESEVQR